MAKKLKLIGEVIAAPAPYLGYVVRVYRYPSGRKLPATRQLVDVTDPHRPRPFATRGQALDALTQWRVDPCSIGVAALPVVLPVAPLPVAKVSARAKAKALKEALVNHAQNYEAARKVPRKHRDVTRVVQPVVKLMTGSPSQNVRYKRDKQTLEVEMMLASGQVTITRCPDAARQWDSKW